MARNKELVKAHDLQVSLFGKRMANLEKQAASIMADVVATERSLQMVSTEGTFSALIKQGGVVIEIENGDFAISTRT